nr:immunoglobulin light chain junction region [Macaca mulatta]MOX11430.1 immunoglobulin light chain junction region [Macaca mulatta]MOX11574.1 immunoglobulin light chain junction region [Macaca mulatta]MOX11594.1 immunoglobulin light chain junction region [Macaca mulatta]MOX11607.1 immunoglobulin light chain junction region [Macaca mulatta]
DYYCGAWDGSLTAYIF